MKKSTQLGQAERRVLFGITLTLLMAMTSAGCVKPVAESETRSAEPGCVSPDVCARAVVDLIAKPDKATLAALLASQKLWAKTRRPSDDRSEQAYEKAMDLVRKKVLDRYPDYFSKNGVTPKTFVRTEKKEGKGGVTKVTLSSEDGKSEFHVFVAEKGGRWFIVERPDADLRPAK